MGKKYRPVAGATSSRVVSAAATKIEDAMAQIESVESSVSPSANRPLQRSGGGRKYVGIEHLTIPILNEIAYERKGGYRSLVKLPGVPEFLPLSDVTRLNVGWHLEVTKAGEPFGIMLSAEALGSVLVIANPGGKRPLIVPPTVEYLNKKYRLSMSKRGGSARPINNSDIMVPYDIGKEENIGFVHAVTGDFVRLPDKDKFSVMEMIIEESYDTMHELFLATDDEGDADYTAGDIREYTDAIFQMDNQDPAHQKLLNDESPCTPELVDAFISAMREKMSPVQYYRELVDRSVDTIDFKKLVNDEGDIVSIPVKSPGDELTNIIHMSSDYLPFNLDWLGKPFKHVSLISDGGEEEEVELHYALDPDTNRLFVAGKEDEVSGDFEPQVFWRFGLATPSTVK